MENSTKSSRITITLPDDVDIKYVISTQDLVISFDQIHPGIIGKIDTQLIVNKKTALKLARVLKRIAMG